MRPASDDGRYPVYVLAVLVLVYVFNFLDRQIVSILAERIKADLGTTDAQMGFLYGTAFAVFYAIFGIPLGRLADVWDRRGLISVGLAFWSVMTAMSGFARSFGQLALARIGVGVGEASASPAAFSMLSDTFPPARRATVLAMYSSGIYIGAGLGLGIGGLVVDRWDAAFAGSPPPFGLRGWQVAFFIVGLPGLLLAAWVATLREPVRGAMDGLPPPPKHPAPFREFARELRAVVPPFTLLHLHLAGAGARAIAANVAAAAALAIAAWGAALALGTPVQWIALAIGLYAAFSWTQALGARDPAAYALIFRTPALRYAGIGFSFLAFTGYATGFWAAPFLMRVHGASAAQVGLILGALSAVAGWLGATTGGILADRLRRRATTGRLQVGLLTALAPLPIAWWAFTTPSTTTVLALVFPLTFLTSLWLGPGASTVQDLVLPRMRATASAAYLLVVTFVGLAMGPYTVGRLSVSLGDLRSAILWSLVANAFAAGFLLLAMRSLEHDQACVLKRAREAGERGLGPDGGEAAAARGRSA
ncbi:MAG TPA: MFS transporter [Candidatus Binatia bacterium]|nr:MFS transporter [Candidatus Binatia bacterium]